MASDRNVPCLQGHGPTQPESWAVLIEFHLKYRVVFRFPVPFEQVMEVASRTRLSGPLPGQQARQVPSWLLSLGAHLLLYLLLSLYIQPVTPRGAGGGEFRTIGISTRTSAESLVDVPGGESNPNLAAGEEGELASDEATAIQEGTNTESPPVDDEPPLPLDIPQRPANDRGSRRPPNPASTSPSGIGARELTRPRGTAAPGKSAGTKHPGQGTGAGAVTFFGGGGQPGTRFVFVLDASASMYENNAIQVAKSELQTSLLQVSEEQDFQIIFYNEELHPMPTTGQRTTMFRGTEANRNRAAQHIRSVQPSGGTRHKEALLEALRLRPDVIFFLTDAGEPWMTAVDLGEIRKRNSGRCRICVVEFGKGSPLSNTDSYWTRRLARENDGSYSYHDVNEFRRR